MPAPSKFSPQEFPEITKTNPSLTLWQSLKLKFYTLLSTGYQYYCLAAYPLFKDKRLGWSLTALASSLRFQLGSFSDDTVQKALGFQPLRAALDGFPQYKGKNGFNVPFTDAKKSQSRWIYEVKNRRPEDPVMLFIHGGGFELKAAPGHIQHVRDVSEKTGISSLMIDYSTVPYFKYPTQLDESYDTYTALSQSCNRIIVAGHSAGGNLALALSLKLKELKETDNLWGLYVLSPWVQFYPQKTGSWVTNKYSDWLPIDWLVKCGKEYSDNGKTENLKIVQPSLATAADWKGAIPRNSLILYGEAELFRDQCAELAETADFTTRFCRAGAIHDFNVMFERGGPNDELVFETFKQWLSS